MMSSMDSETLTFLLRGGHIDMSEVLHQMGPESAGGPGRLEG